MIQSVLFSPLCSVYYSTRCDAVCYMNDRTRHAAMLAKQTMNEHQIHAEATQWMFPTARLLYCTQHITSQNPQPKHTICNDTERRYTTGSPHRSPSVRRLSHWIAEVAVDVSRLLCHGAAAAAEVPAAVLHGVASHAVFLTQLASVVGPEGYER